jgi:hypothetical protein
MRAVISLWVSTDEQAEEGYSLRGVAFVAVVDRIDLSTSFGYPQLFICACGPSCGCHRGHWRSLR